MTQQLTIEIEPVTSVDVWEKYADAWDRLLEKSDYNCLFLRYDMMRLWWKHFGAGSILWILVAKSGQDIVGIAPLTIRVKKVNGLTARCLEFIGDRHFGKQNFIVAPGLCGIVTDFLRFIYDNTHQWDMMWLKEMDHKSPSLLELHSCLEQGRRLNVRKAYSLSPYCQLDPDWNVFWKGLKKMTRKNMRRRQGRLEGAGKLSLVCVNGEKVFDEAFRHILDIEKKSWKNSPELGAFIGEENIAFQYDVARLALDKGWLVMSLLYLNDEPISYQYGFLYNNRFYAYSSSFDPKFQANSPGSLIIKMLMERFCGEGVEEFDLMNGSHAYKYDWATTARQHDQVMAFHGGAYSRMIAITQKHLKPVVKRMLRREDVYV